MHYYGTRLSGNIPRREPDLISVSWPEEEAFAPEEPLASFGGTPATNAPARQSGYREYPGGEGRGERWCTQKLVHSKLSGTTGTVPIVPHSSAVISGF